MSPTIDLMPEYLIRYGNPDPDFQDSEAWEHSTQFRFASIDAVVDYLADYFDQWTRTDSCPSCVEQAGVVRDYLRACRQSGNPVDWDEVAAEGNYYWPAKVGGPLEGPHSE